MDTYATLNDALVKLFRLALLSGENPFLFKGELKKIRLVSNRLGYGPCPEPDEEVEQHITLNAEGQLAQFLQ